MELPKFSAFQLRAQHPLELNKQKMAAFSFFNTGDNFLVMKTIMKLTITDGFTLHEITCFL